MYKPNKCKKPKRPPCPRKAASNVRCYNKIMALIQRGISS